MLEDSGFQVLLFVTAACVWKYLALGSISSQFFLRRRTKKEYAGRLSRVTVYPIKSMKGLELNSANCEYNGMEGRVNGALLKDRSWTVLTPNGNVLSARDKPRLLLILPSIHGDQLQLDAPGQQPVRIPLSLKLGDGKLHHTKVWGLAVEGVDCGDEAAEWISSFLETPGMRLLYHADGTEYQQLNSGDTKWHKRGKDADQMAFQDHFPFMMMSASSMKDLNTKLDSKITSDQFRPNFIVSTDLPPFDEDDWVEIFVGEAVFSNIKPCDRCIMTTVDPKSGERHKDKEPLTTLRSYRLDAKEFGQSPCMGIMLTLVKPGKVQVGDEVYITRRLQYP